MPKVIGGNLVVALTLTILSGCVVTSEGLTAKRLSFGEKSLVEFGGLPGDSPTQENGQLVTELVAIGRTGPYRPIDGEEEAAKLYSMYQLYFDTWQLSRNPALSIEQFKESIAGWTKVEVFTIPTFVSDHRNAFVPRSIVDDVKYPNVAGAFFGDDAGDLIAALTNEDGIFFVTTVLCREDAPDFSDCRDKYEIGVFNASTGEKLDGQLQVKERAPHIDPKTLLRVP